MIQIRKLREYTPVGLSPKKYDAPFEPNISATSVSELFKNCEKLLSLIPEEERYNCFFTLGHGPQEKNRKWEKQNVIGFDIDGVVAPDGTYERLDDYLDIIFEVLGVSKDKTAVILSGNGLQVILEIKEEITKKSFFSDHKPLYKKLCDDLAKAFKEKNLRFKDIDPAAFEPNRMFRLPGTRNLKKDKSPRMARFVLQNLEPQDFILKPLPADLVYEKKKKEQENITLKQLSRLKIDSESVEEGCEFLKWAKENQNDVSEPQWYALTAVVARLANGKEKVHEYSKNHLAYSHQETERKIEYALSGPGPRTCKNISSMFDGCQKCPNFGKVTSPICIKKEDFIATKDSGFYAVGSKGGLIPQHEDLRKMFEQEFHYKTHAISGEVYIYENFSYHPVTLTELKNYADANFNPKAKETDVKEWVARVARSNLIRSDWFVDSTEDLINFKNGVLNIKTGDLLPHSPDYGFLYCLPYNFDPMATAPVFSQFMQNVSCGDQDIQDTLLEYLGYGICDRSYWLQKMVCLIGDGSNGKSTFFEICQAVVGKGNYSSLSVKDLTTETQRKHLEGKLLNFCDELPRSNFRDSELIKKMLGGDISMRSLYHNSYFVKNTTKMFFAGNEIPTSNDSSHGFFRRMVIIPFNAVFSHDPSEHPTAQKTDKSILEKMKEELPGIFNIVFQAYKNLVARGHLKISNQSKEELEAYKDSVDREGAWCRANLVIHTSDLSTKEKYVKKDDLFSRYVSDCKKGEEKPVNRVQFNQRLKKHISDFKKRETRIRMGGKNPVWVLTGVEFSRGEDSDSGPPRQF
jgi:P4 family phage/plasmid primase-like protien